MGGSSGGTGSMPPPPSVPVPRGDGSRASLAATGPVYATLVRVSDAPSTSCLPDLISLQAPGDARVITVGRHRLNEVQLDCPRVPSLLSRQHAEIVCDADGLHSVTDKNTLNGTYLNGNLIPDGPCPLRHGDIIAFGGPANVLRENRTLKNSFRFEYRRPLTAEQWREAVNPRGQGSDARARDLRVCECAREGCALCHPSKRTRREEGNTNRDSTTPATARVSPPSRSSEPSPKPVEEDDDAELGAVGKFLMQSPGDTPEGYRRPGRSVVKLSRRDMISVQRIASVHARRSPEFLRCALVEVGASLAESAIPVRDDDETAFVELIIDHSSGGGCFSNIRDALSITTSASQSAPEVEMTQMTQATQEYAMPFASNKASDAVGAATPFIRQVCRESLELHVAPSGAVTFGLKLLSAGCVWDSEVYSAKEKSSTVFKRGDLIAETVALATWPQQQLGWEGGAIDGDGDTSNRVFASSVSEVDGYGCDIGPIGCIAIAEGMLKPRQTVDGRWIFNASLRGFRLGKNPRIGDDGCCALADALKPKACISGATVFNGSLAVLDLSGCGIGPKGAVALANALKLVSSSNTDWVFPSNLRALKLSGNRIGTEGARAMASLLIPLPNEGSGTWSFNPSLEILDLSDNHGMDDSVAQEFAKALQPRRVKSTKRGRDGGNEAGQYMVNVALSELGLCGHSFSQAGLDMITASLDPKRNGSGGAASASTRVNLERTKSIGQDSNLTDQKMNTVLVLPAATGCAAEHRDLSHWHWQAWRTKLFPGADGHDSQMATSNKFIPPIWQRALLEDYHTGGSTIPWSTGFALRTVLLQRMEDTDYILPEEQETLTAGLPDWLDDELRCVICTETFVNPYAIHGCGHVFCHDCVSQWFDTRSNQCPICRHRLQVPASLALTPCTMTQKLLERYVLPYLPSKDVEARRERAREVRDNKAARASEASQVPSGGDSGRTVNIAAAAATAAAMLLSGNPSLGDGARAGLSPSNASLQQMLQLHAQRAMRAMQSRQLAAQSSGQSQDDMNVHEDLTQSTESAQEVLRNLQESRRRRHEQIAAVLTRVRGQGVEIPLFPATDVPGSPASANNEDPLAAMEALLLRRRHGTMNTNGDVRAEGVTWTAMSTNVDHSTPCHHCRANIPPRFLRMRRVLATGVQEYYHANYDCLRSVHSEICDISSIQGLDTLSEQERRVLTAITSVVGTRIV